MHRDWYSPAIIYLSELYLKQAEENKEKDEVRGIDFDYLIFDCPLIDNGCDSPYLLEEGDDLCYLHPMRSWHSTNDARSG